MSRAIAPARALAFETIRETFERDAFTERAFRAGADRLGLAGRDRAQAQRLAYGAVQRRGQRLTLAGGAAQDRVDEAARVAGTGPLDQLHRLVDGCVVGRAVGEQQLVEAQP